MAASGDCYRANGRFVVSHMSDDNVKLCHGVGILQSDGKPFGHAWVLYGDRVIDKSNGQDINFPKKLYYGLLKAPVKGTRIYEYTGEQVAKLMFQYKHWGPWDSKPPR